MRQYEVIEFGESVTIAYEENGVRLSFPDNPSNPDYAEYLRYTAWVEAGNDPEQFWVAEGNEPTQLEQP